MANSSSTIFPLSFIFTRNSVIKQFTYDYTYFIYFSAKLHCSALRQNHPWKSFLLWPFGLYSSMWLSKAIEGQTCTLLSSCSFFILLFHYSQDKESPTHSTITRISHDSSPNCEIQFCLRPFLWFLSAVLFNVNLQWFDLKQIWDESVCFPRESLFNVWFLEIRHILGQFCLLLSY